MPEKRSVRTVEVSWSSLLCNQKNCNGYRADFAVCKDPIGRQEREAKKVGWPLYTNIVSRFLDRTELDKGA
jgi:hypothetical protein